VHRSAADAPSVFCSRFQVTAAVKAAPTTTTVCAAVTWTMPAIVSATAAPNSSGPSRLQTAARVIAGPGRAPRVATRVAIALAASWKPLVNANANVTTTASTNAASTARHPLARLARILAQPSASPAPRRQQPSQQVKAVTLRSSRCRR
jgi:hypothetical protein